MKKLLLLTACSLALFGTAQNSVNITSQQYQVLKQNHQLDVTKRYVFTDAGSTNNTPVHYQGAMRSPSTLCSCTVPLDTTFIVAPITMGGLGIPPYYRNDDGSTPAIALPFTFNFYGTNYDSIYINNNGNVSFGSGYPTFTANPFPDSTYSMLAPFWADVDTRDTTGGVNGLVYYKVTPTALIVKWEGVGYYPQLSDKLNTFQLIITDGTDPLLPAGDNVGFCYGDMQWTTGSASGGVNGFGGTPATVGVNKGDGVNYFQVGRFDSAGVAFDGPYGNSDKVDWLDNQGMYFNVSTSAGNNIPPVIINNNICDTIDVATGDTTHSMLVDSVQFMFKVSTPEPNQTVNATITSSDATHLSYSLVTNNATYKEYQCSFSVRNLATGLHTITINAIDDGTPAAQSSRTVFIKSHFDPSLITTSIKENDNASFVSIYPNPTEGIFTISSTKYKVANIKITDVLGNIVNNQQTTSNSTTIDLSNYAKGVYFATVTDRDGNSKTIKVVRK